MGNTLLHRAEGSWYYHLQVEIGACCYASCDVQHPGVTGSIQGDTAADGIGTLHRKEERTELIRATQCGNLGL